MIVFTGVVIAFVFMLYVKPPFVPTAKVKKAGATTVAADTSVKQAATQ